MDEELAAAHAAYLVNREKEYGAFLHEWNRLVTLGVESGFMEVHNVWAAPLPPERVLGQVRMAQHAEQDPHTEFLD